MVMKWCSKLESVYQRYPIGFKCHLSTFKVTRNKKSPILTQFIPFRTVTPVWIHIWQQNCRLSLVWGRERCPIVFQVHLSNFKVTQLTKIVDFGANWAFPDCNSSLNSPMVMKWCTTPEEAESCPIVFQCHLSNFQVTRDKKIGL